MADNATSPAAFDWASGIDWAPGTSPLEDPGVFREKIDRNPGSARDLTGVSSKFVPTEANQALLRSLGYQGELTQLLPDPLFGAMESYNGEQVTAWTPEAMRHLYDRGYGISVGHQPGSKSGGRPEYWGLMGPDGKFVAGQSAPTYTMSDSLMDHIMPFALAAGPLFSAVSTSMAGAAGAAGAGAGAGAAGAGVSSGLGAGAGAGVSSMAGLSPQALGLTGAIGSGASAAELAALSGAFPGAVAGGGSSLLGTLGAGALKGAGLGAVQGAATGRNIGKSALLGALGGAVGAGVTSLNPAGALGVQSVAGKGLINGAISGGVKAGLGGGNVLQGAVTGGVTGGVSGLNPGGAILDNPRGAGLVNGALSSALLGRDPKQIGAQLVGGVVNMLGSPGAPTIGRLGDGASDVTALGPGWSPEALGLTGAIGSGANAMDKRDAMDEEYGGYNEDDWQGLFDEAYQKNQQDMNSWLSQNGYVPDDPGNYGNEGRNYGEGGLDPSTNSPVNTSSESSWWESLLSGVKTGVGSIFGTGSSGSTSFNSGSLLGSIFGGTKGSDVLGMLGTGVTAAMLERQSEKNREFQKELQNRAWAREDEKEAQRRARLMPASGPGLLNARISTIPGDAARVGG